ncbi:KUP/HAK/KT family potassium transporter [Horticoccus luteus]|uniref:Probable potassium transport system protein Kup n=1 Tax=Horticoccus luteus TaxID=2862869 RepID=A0A8F9TTW8_9BACT|nr:KUP/HAK/KT family potassium transporter [Horticoccus luteus]QYM77703.1 KUP/HAK/KT family potassium transporter [Horticoccus luteus]
MSTTAPTPARSPAKAALTIGALGVVFGDIGTSPLYSMRECLAQIDPTARAAGVIGILSLMLWALIIVVCIKYIGLVTRADNRGEGGIFTLLALSHTRNDPRRNSLNFTVLIILAGAALLYGDSVITPAISVLSAAEGLKTVSPAFDHYIPLIACVILAGLFWMQRHGTHAIGRIFGPVMLTWFTVLGLLGLWHIHESPQVLAALNPLAGVRLLLNSPGTAFILLGSVVLTITGAEALYADMGHFGRPAIMRAWFLFAFPGLLLNYFGQGAHVLQNPASVDNPFFALAPAGWPQLALTLLSVVAAVIASQAVISGAYSLTRSAIQLGYFPRLKITHTNAAQEGQIFVPLINSALAIVSILVVATFKSSDRLASAYGIAVTGTMVVTTYAFFHVARRHWHWPLWRAVTVCSLFMAVDLTFFIATLHKFADGGWLPIAIALAVIVIMHTWKRGKNEIQEKVYSRALAELELSQISQSKSIVRVPGSAVFMAGSPRGVPLALLHHLKANKCLQQTVVLMTIINEELPHVADDERLTIEDHGNGVWRAICRYGYMETPDVSSIMQRVRERDVPLNPQGATFYFNREMIISGGSAKMWEWQKSFYAFLSRNARPVKDYYQIVPTQIIEIGLPIQL